jgi:hypothetical protein
VYHSQDLKNVFCFVTHESLAFWQGLPIAEEIAGLDGTWMLMDVPTSGGAHNPFLTGHHPMHLSSSPSGHNQVPTMTALGRTPPRRPTAPQKVPSMPGSSGSGMFYMTGNFFQSIVFFFL